MERKWNTLWRNNISKIARITIVALLVLTLFPLISCGEKYEGIIDSYKIGDVAGVATLFVTVKGNCDLEAVLTKDENELCSKLIQKRQLEDGQEVINLNLSSRPYESPIGGTYAVKLYHDDKLVSTECFFKSSPSLKITYFNPSFKTYSSLGEMICNNIEVSFSNVGDLPAYVCEIYLDNVLDHTLKTVSENSRYIEPGESMTLSGAVYLESSLWGIDFSNLSIMVSLLDVNGKKLNSFYSWSGY